MNIKRITLCHECAFKRAKNKQEIAPDKNQAYTMATGICQDCGQRRSVRRYLVYDYRAGGETK